MPQRPWHLGAPPGHRLYSLCPARVPQRRHLFHLFLCLFFSRYPAVLPSCSAQVFTPSLIQALFSHFSHPFMVCFFSVSLTRPFVIQAAASRDDLLRGSAGTSTSLIFVLRTSPFSVLSSALDVSCVLLPFCVGFVPSCVSVSHFRLLLLTIARFMGYFCVRTARLVGHG